MPTIMKSTAKYEIALSQQAWTPNGWYPKGHACYGFSHYSYAPFSHIPNYVIQNAEKNGVPLREACIAYAEEKYGPTVFSVHGSYKLREITHTTENVDEETATETIKSTTESVHTVIFHEYYRTEEDTEKYYTSQLEAFKLREAERAKVWEEEMSVIRERIAEKDRIEAETAELKLVEERKNKSVFRRIKNMFS